MGSLKTLLTLVANEGQSESITIIFSKNPRKILEKPGQAGAVRNRLL